MLAPYDVIVLGVGGVGSAALMHLARRGARVLGIDRFPGGHDRGSSHGETRIIRQAYFEHSDYVPLLLRTYELWAELEQTVGEKLFHQVGLLQIGRPDGGVIAGVLESARRHRLDVESLSADEVERRFPGFHVPRDYVAAFEPRAGYLRVERCVLAHLTAAKSHGAEFIVGESIVGWTESAGEFVVTTDRNSYRAKKLVIAPGPWAEKLLPSLGVPLHVHRKHVYWFGDCDASYHAASGCPTYLYELPHGVFYGIPTIDSRGLKAAEHSGGELVMDPLNDARTPDAVDQARVMSFLEEYLPGVGPRVSHQNVCFYTMTPDENFLIDVLPDHPGVAFAAGLSGHGFKFTAVLGEILADLTVNGRTAHPIEFLRMARFD